jgi:hypothetical protein
VSSSPPSSGKAKFWSFYLPPTASSLRDEENFAVYLTFHASFGGDTEFEMWAESALCGRRCDIWNVEKNNVNIR